MIIKKLKLRFGRGEISGMFGDMGTFLPLVAGLAGQCGMNLAHIFFVSGLANIFTGIWFRIPIPVQPMKAIAAVAIAEGMGQESIIAAGILTGLLLLILALVGLVDYLYRIIPKPVIRGLQLAVGLKLFIKGGTMALDSGVWLAYDSILTGVICFGLALCLFIIRSRIGALIIFIAGIGLVFIEARPELSNLAMGWSALSLHIPTSVDFIDGFWRGTLPQLPLTLLNSVIAVCALSIDLFPNNRMLPKKTAISIGLINLFGCPLGGMPMCHGAGGLAAQYHFGARTGGSMVMLGSLKIILALIFGVSLMTIISLYPLSILGVLLMFAGLQLALVCRDMRKWREISLMLITAVGCMAIGIGIGFLLGFVVAILINFWHNRANRVDDIEL